VFLLAQAFSFLCKYRAKRGNPQEAAYNLGRAAHQLGLMHVAIPFYEQALALRPAERGSATDLSREAAHNVVMIYKATGAIALAREVMHEYLTV
jgi:general transcription factor 3C polypeptide 3 (transcription factor C subunit 4)